MNPFDPNEQKLQSAYSRLIDKLDQTFTALEQLNEDLSEMSQLVCAKLLSELKSGSISAYNGSCAYSNIVNGSGRLQKQILGLLAAVKEAGPMAHSATPHQETDEQRRLRRISEKALTLLARASEDRG